MNAILSGRTLNLGFDIVDRVRALDLECDSLARKGLNKAVCKVSIWSRCWKGRETLTIEVRKEDEAYICTESEDAALVHISRASEEH